MNFRSQGSEYFFDLYRRENARAIKVAKIITKFPGGQKLVSKIIRKKFEKVARTDHGPLNWVENNRLEYIEPFFISKEHREAISPSIKDFKPYTDYDRVVYIDHGYDETKPENSLDITAIKKAARFRGGECLSQHMTKGDMQTKLLFKCAFGHVFEASPKLVLEGGHWCPQCERESWNYHELAKRSEFFAQVWYPLHSKDEPSRMYPKIVNELGCE